jgi:hypothetical protein
MAETERSRLLPAAAVLALALGACGGDGVTPPTPPPQPPPTPCTRSTVFSNSGSIPARVIVFADIPVPDSGQLDMTLDWTFASSLMGLYLVPAGTCTVGEFNARTCTFLVRSEPPGPKPRTMSAPNIQAGNYRFLIANFSAEDESAALQILLSRGSCAPPAGAGPAISSGRLQPPLTVQRAARR